MRCTGAGAEPVLVVTEDQCLEEDAGDVLRINALPTT
jgi:hypothetical protein